MSLINNIIFVLRGEHDVKYDVIIQQVSYHHLGKIYHLLHLKLLSKYLLMGEGFMGGVSMVKIFHFSGEWKVVSVAPQRGGVHPAHKSRGVFYTHIGHGN